MQYIKLFMAILFTLRFFARNLLRGNCRRNIFFYISFLMPDLGFTSNKPTYCLLDYGVFLVGLVNLKLHFFSALKMVILCSLLKKCNTENGWHVFFLILLPYESIHKAFHGNFIYYQSFCQKSAERKSPKKYFMYFVLMSSLGLEPWILRLSQHTTY